ncbi:MAG: HAD-IB family phosphatase [Planctomycetaceae bacterium]|nr:HAD-IB family phosphatase [Planctomycetaceae bacterium]
MDGGAKRLITDFDGTMARNDFYACAVDLLLQPEDLAPFEEYAAGRISHFEALQQILGRIRATDRQMQETMDAMQFDPRAGAAVADLSAGGWDVQVVSNGCSWYIERLLQQYAVTVEVLTNPGTYSPEGGLQIELPRGSPFFDERVGISKAAVVRAALANGDCHEVAFAGDGRPDLEPALLVQPQFRFARGWLAETLTQQGEPFQPFEVWSEIATVLCAVS